MPRSQGSIRHIRRQSRAHSSHRKSAIPVITTATGPLASRPIASPAKNHQPSLPPGWTRVTARQNATMDSVMPKVMKTSVATAPAIRKPSTDDSSTSAAAADAAPRGAGACGQRRNSAAVAIEAISVATRAPNSLTPNTAIVAAAAQNDSGGLPQNGTP